MTSKRHPTPNPPSPPPTLYLPAQEFLPGGMFAQRPAFAKEVPPEATALVSTVEPAWASLVGAS